MGGLGCVSSNAEPGGRLHSTWHLSTGSPHCLLTSTTYGLFNLDPLPQSTTTPPTPPPPFTLTDSFIPTNFLSLCSEPRPVPSRPQFINSCLEADSCRLSPIPNNEILNSNLKETTHPKLNRNSTFLKQPSSLLKKTRIRK
ncbi:hypothetical protein ES332_D08G138000v1 [Gossypium tomentosum]|uniref:Uncharacterized protein n=1 Tax=Gossypium tomentosum TaxID=34277 RepID=A0A5D2JTQ9_GOSTO|nr:hypothetical protein ES332_D08G138000v1 [Gossypium tomentosum]